MDSKMGKVFVFISVCFIAFCAATLAAVIIVESAHPQVVEPDANDDRLGGASFRYEKDDDDPEKNGEESQLFADISGDAADVGSIDDMDGITGIVEEKKLRPAPSEVIDSIPFKKKVQLIKKYMQKLSSQDIKLFAGLLSGEDKDYEEIKQRFYEIYTSQEIEDMYKIYKEYEEKFYESQS